MTFPESTTCLQVTGVTSSGTRPSEFLALEPWHIAEATIMQAGRLEPMAVHGVVITWRPVTSEMTGAGWRVSEMKSAQAEARLAGRGRVASYGVRAGSLPAGVSAT
jgi:hypothetical protein